MNHPFGFKMEFRIVLHPEESHFFLLSFIFIICSYVYDILRYYSFILWNMACFLFPLSAEVMNACVSCLQLVEWYQPTFMVGILTSISLI